MRPEGAISEVIESGGAAAVLYHDASRTAGAAGLLPLIAADLERPHVVDSIVHQPAGGARADPVAASVLLPLALFRVLTERQTWPVELPLRVRYKRWQESGRAHPPG